MNKLLVIQAAALGFDFLSKCGGEDTLNGLSFKKAESVFPALTCPVQATMRTALPPSSHGMVMNGVFAENLRRPLFWEQSSRLVQGERIWSGAQEGKLKTGMLFWQQSLGEQADVLLSPAPIHKHGGGMVESVYSRPDGLYDYLVNRLKRPFKLSSYWGPLSSLKSSKWITEAAAEIMDMPDVAPDLLFVYIPHLDYALQKYGPGSGKAEKAFSEFAALLNSLTEKGRASGYDILVYGDYAIADVSSAVFPNRMLAENNLFRTRSVRGRLYPDFGYSDAFAVCDHETAHVYVHKKDQIETITHMFENSDGIEEVITRTGSSSGQFHEKAGDIILVAAQGTWCAYPWWNSSREAPDYAAHVDIHNKPGYDPCELFFGWHPFITSTDTSKVRGSHGRTGKGRETAWASTLSFEQDPGSLLEIAKAVQNKLYDQNRKNV